MASRRWRALGACALFFAQVAGAADLEGVRADLERVASQVGELERVYLAPEVLARNERLTARLNDGQLLYLTRDYERAAMVLFDVVDDRENRSHPAYAEAVFYLAESLYELGNDRPARDYFVEALNYARPNERRIAVARLLDIAVRTQDAVAAQTYLAKAGELVGEAPDGALYYAIGRYHYRIGRHAEALEAFDKVAADHPLKVRANYFAGVACVRLKKLDVAAERFLQAVEAPETPASVTGDNDAVEIRDLARLALARLLYEQGLLDEAVVAYETLDEGSTKYDRAVYESVWISVKQLDYEAAVRKLELLLISQPDVLRAPDVRLLQGKLQLMLSRFNESSLAYQEVLYEFNPIQADMNRVLEAQKNDLEGHFNRVIGKNLAQFDLTSFLPPRAAEFAGPDIEADRALVLVGALAQEKRDIDEARRTVERLDAALQGPNRVEIFPRLHEGTLRALEARARLVEARARLNDAAASGRFDADAEYQRLSSERRALGEKYARTPRTATALQERDDRVDDELRRLEGASHRLSVDIRGLEAQLSALDKYVRDTTASRGETGSEQALYTQVERELSEARTLRARFDELSRALDLERIRTGVNDPASNEDERLRKAYGAALDAEEKWLSDRGAAPSGAEKQRCAELEARLAGYLEKSTKLVDDRILDIRRQVDKERTNVTNYDSQLAAYQGETESLGGKIAARSFLNVEARIDAVVLEADVGLVDIAWKQKQDQSTAIANTRARERSELDAMEQLLKEASGEK